jgi:hypothetical protein
MILQSQGRWEKLQGSSDHEAAVKERRKEDLTYVSFLISDVCAKPISGEPISAKNGYEMKRRSSLLL